MFYKKSQTVIKLECDVECSNPAVTNYEWYDNCPEPSKKDNCSLLRQGPEYNTYDYALNPSKPMNVICKATNLINFSEMKFSFNKLDETSGNY